MLRSQAPIVVAVAFIDRINHGDVDGLAALMTEDYELKVFSEPAEKGRDNGISGWLGYCTSFPNYVIWPYRIAVKGDTVAILGTTTGSHLGLPDEEESKLTLIWLGQVRDGLIARWTLIEDTAANRTTWDLDEGVSSTVAQSFV